MEWPVAMLVMVATPIKAEGEGYTMKDSYGRYLGFDGTHTTSFQLYTEVSDGGGFNEDGFVYRRNNHFALEFEELGFGGILGELFGQVASETASPPEKLPSPSPPKATPVW